MDHLNPSHQVTYTMIKYLKIHYGYFNDTKANHSKLFSGDVRDRKSLLGSGHHRIHSL